MEFETLSLEKRDSLAIITYNQPENMNASHSQAITDLTAVVNAIEADAQIKAVILWGGPNVDIKFMLEASPLDMENFIERCHSIHNKIASSSKPYIAAIAGLALGLCLETALACDIRIATENSVLGLTEMNLGITPGAGGTQRLPRIVGSGWARHLIMTGEMIDAQTAFTIGLVTQLVPAHELLNAAENIATSLTFKSPLAIHAAKKCLQKSEDVDLPTGLAYEQKSWAFLFRSEDQREGMKAFLEKRKPIYTGT